jgi:hypothetical protein
VSFYIGDTAGDGAATFETAPGVFAVYVDSALPTTWRKRALLHELGHVAGLDVDPQSSDAAHWHDTTPSVMRPLIDDCADEIGAPELAAFEREYGGAR